MSHSVAKYLSALRIELMKTIEYKFEFILRLLRIPIYVFLLVIVWLTIFEKSNALEIAGMNAQMFVMYIIVARLITYCCHRQWEIHTILLDYVRTGKISLFLSKPLRFSPWFFFQSMSQGFFQFIVVLFVLAAGMLARYFGFEYFFPTATYFLLFIISTCLAMLLAFLIYYTLSLLIFWFGDVWSIWGVVEGTMILLTGEIIPLTVTPWFYFITSLLPFKHIVFTPVFIYLEKFSITEVLQQMGIQLLWIFVFILLAGWILKAGLKKTDIQGG